uniref:Lipocalin n=1 Tax=Rhipicephalus appendiculatus TaxID=34631 RepID=A0A131YF55_RHIAP
MQLKKTFLAFLSCAAKYISAYADSSTEMVAKREEWSRHGSTTIGIYTCHTDINTPCWYRVFTYLNTPINRSNLFLTSSTLVTTFFSKQKRDIFGAAD